jgi:HEAT repeat protein
MPYIPDWGEFLAAYSVKSVSIHEVLRGGMNIALIGQPGTGKSTALANLCSLVARKSPSTGYLNHLIPVLIHARDLIEFPHADNPIQQIIEITSSYHPDLPSARVDAIFRELFNQNSILLLIDGLDELPRNLIQDTRDEIKVLLSQFPGTRFILSGPMDYLDGYLEIGAYPLVMGHWNRLNRNQFIRKLAKAYFDRFESNLPDEEKDLRLQSILTWSAHQDTSFTALIYSIQIISALAGLEVGKTSFDILQNYINHLVPASSTKASLEVLAYQTIISENPIINKYEIDHYVPELIQSPESEPVVASMDNVKATKALSLVSKRMILQPTNHGNVIFTHPVFLGFLASNALIRNGQCQAVFNQPDWSAKEISLKYLSHMIDITQYIQPEKLDDDGPLFQRLFVISHWLRECKSGAIFRPQVMRRLAQLLTNDNQPFTIRARAAASLVFANEKNIIGLFKQYCNSNSPTVRRLSALACGILQDPAVLKELTELLGDSDPQVRNAAAMAISTFNTAQAQELTAQILLQADESMRRVIAEMLTLNQAEGIQTLRDGAGYKDILVRRACVYALGLIREKWSVDLLKKLQTEDGQWVIRNTAAQMLENITNLDAHVPRKVPEAYLAPWLVAYASRNGEGISPTISSLPLLIRVLSNGSDDEKIAAMDYLGWSSEEGVIARLYDAIYQRQSNVREYALYTLWKISLSGVRFPSLKKFGLG